MRAESTASRSARASSCSAPRSVPLIVAYFLLGAVAALGGAGLDPRYTRAASPASLLSRASSCSASRSAPLIV
eukprot:3935476-Alexandrium_andersonii.AAC.1